MSVQMTNSTIERFNGVRWHDSKLLGLCFYREGLEELVKLSLKLLEKDGALTPVDLLFRESTYIKLEVDLEGKSQTSDDISDAECSAESEWLRTLTAGNPYDSFEGYLHFRISLIPPGGAINILAKDFSFEPTASP
jgi:hypothetical protein